jgi:hypothetical protein
MRSLLTVALLSFTLMPGVATASGWRQVGYLDSPSYTVISPAYQLSSPIALYHSRTFAAPMVTGVYAQPQTYLATGYYTTQVQVPVQVQVQAQVQQPQAYVMQQVAQPCCVVEEGPQYVIEQKTRVRRVKNRHRYQRSIVYSQSYVPAQATYSSTTAAATVDSSSQPPLPTGVAP